MSHGKNTAGSMWPYDMTPRWAATASSASMPVLLELDSSQQLLSGLPVTDLAGTIFHPAHFRARGGLTLSGKNFSLSAFLNHSGAVTDSRRPASVKIEGRRRSISPAA